MPASPANYLITLPNFALYFVVGLILVAVFLRVYTWVTPYREFDLICAGNTAAAISLGGATIGFILPLASAVAHSLGIVDVLIWGVIAMIVQLLIYVVARFAVPQLAADITAGKPAAAVSLAAASLGIGILNAACMTY
jgi:putative membrane protein